MTSTARKSQKPTVVVRHTISDLPGVQDLGVGLRDFLCRGYITTPVSPEILNQKNNNMEGCMSFDLSLI